MLGLRRAARNNGRVLLLYRCGQRASGRSWSCHSSQLDKNFPIRVNSPAPETSAKQYWQVGQPSTLNVTNLLDVRPKSIHKFPMIVLGVCFNKRL